MMKLQLLARNACSRSIGPVRLPALRSVRSALTSGLLVGTLIAPSLARSDSYVISASISQPMEFETFHSGGPPMTASVWFLSSHILQYRAGAYEWINLDAIYCNGFDSTIVKDYLIDGPVQTNAQGLYDNYEVLSQYRSVGHGVHYAWAETNLWYPGWPGYDWATDDPHQFTVTW